MSKVPPPVLVVEDDAKIANMLLNYLQAQSWQTLYASEGQAAVRLDRKSVV